MNQPRNEPGLVERGRSLVDSARQRPLATALVFTVMLAVLLLAYSMATSSGNDGGGSGEAESSTSQPASGEADSGFLAEGYAELEGESDTGGSSGWWGDVPGLLIRLVIVLGLAYGSLRLLNYFTRSGRIGGAGGRALEVVDHLNLGQNRSIYLVRVSGRVLVVGATGNQLNLLSRMSVDDLPEDVRTRAPNFTSQLQSRILRQVNGATGENSDLEERRRSLRQLRDEDPVPS